MPLRISIWCGTGATTLTCGHHAPSLVDVDVHAQPVDENGDLLRRSRSALDVRRPFSGDMAERLADLAQCSSCLVFTAMPGACKTAGCTEEMHVYDAFSTAGGLAGKSVCHHVSEALVNLAMTENIIVISNSPDHDPRVQFTLPATHERMRNVMITPLFVGEWANARRVGVVVFLNKLVARDECNGGFTARDYANLHFTLVEAALHMYTSFYEMGLRNLQSHYERARLQHMEEIARMALSRDTFIATMSHEIRTPLNAVSGYNELLTRNNGTIDIANCLRKQREAILQLTQLIANILDFTKLKSDSLKLTSKPFVLRDVLRETTDIVRTDCAAKQISLTWVAAENAPDVVLGDSGRVQQVLLNLLSNAVKYTSVGGSVVLEAAVTKQDEGMATLQFSVTDTGRGIPQFLQEKIFEDFQQIRDTMETSASVQGVGLGLAICKELVRLMHGRIWVESDGHNGSKFCFLAEFRDSGGMKTLLDAAGTMLHDAPVLIVDDKEVNRILMTKMMVEWGFRPHACSSIDEAVHLLEAFPPTYFKVALIDIDISGESGIGLVRLINQRGDMASMLLLAVSSMGTSFSGADEFDAIHEKPIRPDMLLADIVKLTRSGSCRRRHVSIERHELPRRANGKKRQKILIVDDDEPSRVVTKDMILSLGYAEPAILVTTSGKEALRLLRDDPGGVACVFMDLVMPVMSGIECTRAIRKDPSKYGTPHIVALSADAVDNTRLVALEAGAEAFLSKPVSLDSLQNVLAAVCPLGRSVKKLKRRKKCAAKA